MIGAVEEFGGSLSEFTGDGVLALFGAPVAHEDDPERAVLAGLRIVERDRRATRRRSRDAGDRGLAVRIGIETGPGRAGARRARAAGRVHGATGDALNTAARLQAAAPPGAVLVGARTHRGWSSARSNGASPSSWS